MLRIFHILTVVLGLFCYSILAEASGLSIMYWNNHTGAFVSQETTIFLSTDAPCQAYNALENFATVSPLMPLRLAISSEKQNMLNFVLLDPTLGVLNQSTGSVFEVSYQKSGSTRLQGFLGPNQVIDLTLLFVPEQKIRVNFYHIHDAAGRTAWKFKQENMLANTQRAQAILNQVGITLEIHSQENIYLPLSIGEAVDADTTTLSEEEVVILNQIGSSDGDVSIISVWDYKIDTESKAGMNYTLPGKGEIIFITDQTTKPGETIAHEVLHALGIEHTDLGGDYLMNDEESVGKSQCLLSQTETWQVAQSI